MIRLLSVIKPTSVDEALSDDGWILAMQEELNKFQRNDVSDLVPKPQQNNIIGTKWVFRNKLNEQGEVVRNKARLIGQGYSQQKGIDYEGEKNHKKGGLNCVFGNFFFHVLDNCPQVQSLKQFRV